MAELLSKELTAIDVDRKEYQNVGTRLGGKTRTSVSEIELTDAGAGTTLYMARLPKGALLLGGFITADALGASVTLAVGSRTKNEVGAEVDALDADKYLSATSMNTANKRVDLTASVPVAESTSSLSRSSPPPARRRSPGPRAASRRRGVVRARARRPGPGS